MSHYYCINSTEYPSYTPSYSTDDTKQEEQTDDKKQPLQSNES